MQYFVLPLFLKARPPVADTKRLKSSCHGAAASAKNSLARIFMIYYKLTPCYIYTSANFGCLRSGSPSGGLGSRQPHQADFEELFNGVGVVLLLVLTDVFSLSSKSVFGIDGRPSWVLPLCGARSRSTMLQRCYPGSSKYKQNTDSVTRLERENSQNVSDLAKIIHVCSNHAHMYKTSFHVAYFNILQF